MNWNDSYSGPDTPGNGGTNSGSEVANRTLRSNAKSVAARVRHLLPAEYSVTGDVAESAGGPQAFVAIQPPVGPAITAGFGLEEYASQNGTSDIPDDERNEVAAGLAARAALQVKQAVGDAITPTAR